jgi:hypothetical protein
LTVIAAYLPLRFWDLGDVIRDNAGVEGVDFLTEVGCWFVVVDESSGGVERRVEGLVVVGGEKQFT